MPLLYGDRISDVDSARLIDKLRSRGTVDAILATTTFGTSPRRDATPASAIRARDAILYELRQWDRLDDEAPVLAALRDRLTSPPQGRRII